MPVKVSPCICTHIPMNMSGPQEDATTKKWNPTKNTLLGSTDLL